MAFKGLSEIIRDSIKVNVPQTQNHPTTTEQSILLSQGNIYFKDESNGDITGVFRWGFSVWGVDPIIGVKYPNEL